MPFVRGMTYNYTTLTTGTTIVGLMPPYQQNDLLLAIITADTYDATGGFSAALNSGWSVLFAVTNTVYMAVLWKIAGASETDYTFTSSDSETYNCRMLSVGDVNTTTPFNGTGGAGTGYRTANTSAARTAMPELTTTVNESLLIFAVAGSANEVPSIIEGACIMLGASDGSAHSDGCSWGFLTTAGAHPQSVASKTGTTAAILATIGISPPSGGATVIPAHCAADSSIYVDPIHGVTAFNSNTAFAATITTYFGTSMNGKTLGNGTAAAAADVGLNSFHSMGQLTGSATGNQWIGAASVIADGNKPNVSGKNVLCHVKPSTPKVYQNTDSITKAGVSGVAFGMCSTANTDYRVWHVHGDNTKWNSAQHIPIVINDGNTSGRIQNTGTLNAASVKAFGFAVSGYTVAPVFQFGSLWVLDMTTVAGGNAANPIDISGIVNACAVGKERMSVLQQGASQCLSLQPIQIGNGGTSQTYLNLDATAIEFPKQYSVSSRDVFYCSADNVAGLQYYPGASDTIKHKNSVVSSLSRFFWGLHDSANTSATYDFSGLSVIGAGTVKLHRAITVSGLTLNDYSTLNASNVTLSGCTIKAPPSTNDSVTTNSSTTVSGCIIDVSTVASGNRWLSTATPDKFSGNSFIGGGGHALRITTPGTYTLSANTFTGFGADGSNGAAIYNDSGGAVTLTITNGGSTPTVKNGSGASTTVNNNKTLTLTGLLTGSDIVILTAGTTTERVNVDAHGSTTYDFNYAYTASDFVDIQIFKAGYVPFIVRNYLLANANGSLPIAQALDRYYLA